MKTKQMYAVGAALILFYSYDAKIARPAAASRQERQPMTRSKFYCNTKALNSEERGRHKMLTDKLVAQRTGIVESEKGYEFQYSSSVVSLSELSEWVAAESKCCPFFDFHIDLENEGTLLCLRLTGAQGVKAFVRAEFSVSATD